MPVASVLWAMAFFMVYLLALWTVTTRALHRSSQQRPLLEPRPWNLIETDEPLDPLGWEYGYAQATASEAMRDRQATINFYLLVVGVAATGLLGLTKGNTLPLHLAAGLSWVVCCLGAFYFLIMVKLRESWHGSTRHLLEIRDFTILHTKGLPDTTLNRSPHAPHGAFRWHKETLPDKAKRWTVFYYSAMLIAFLNAVTYFLGAMLIARYFNEACEHRLAYFGALAVTLFLWHDVLYEKLLTDPKPKSTPSHPTENDMKRPRKVKIFSEEEEWASDGGFRVVRAELQHELFAGGMGEPISRINFERGESVGVLLFDPEHEEVVLVRQFRYPVYASLPSEEIEEEGAGRAWTLEIVAGVRETGRTVEQVARQELLEEAGYRLAGKLEEIASVYPSPGGTSERITIFLGEVQRGERVEEGGGVAAEGEDTRVEIFPLERALIMVEQGEITDAKTVIALQHLALKSGQGGG